MGWCYVTFVILKRYFNLKLESWSVSSSPDIRKMRLRDRQPRSQVLSGNSQNKIRKFFQQPLIFFFCCFHTDGVQQLCPQDIVMLQQLAGNKVELGKLFVKRVKLGVRYIVELTVFQCLDPFVGWGAVEKTFDWNYYVICCRIPPQVQGSVEAVKSMYAI